MPKPRTNDPIGVSDNPICVSDPQREAELIAEFRRKITYFQWHYLTAKRFVGDSKAYNESLKDLTRALAGKVPRRLSGKRLDTQFELAISHHARQFSALRTGNNDGEVSCEDIAQASERAIELLKPKEGPPKSQVLWHHVAGLMALIQESTGKPVMARRYRNSDYAPHFAPGISQIVPQIFEEIAPDVTLSQLVTIAEKTRTQYAGRRMSFLDFFPGYGARLEQDGRLILGNGQTAEGIEQNFPICFR